MAMSEDAQPGAVSRAPRRSMGATLVIHGVALCALAALLVRVVPIYEDAFRDARMTLPAATQIVISASHLAKQYVILLFPIVLAADAGVLALLRSSDQSGRLRRCWTWLFLVAILLFGAFTLYAICYREVPGVPPLPAERGLVMKDQPSDLPKA